MINDQMYDWILLEDDEEFVDLNYKFDVYDGEEEMIQKIESEVREKKSQKLISRPNPKMQGVGGKSKSDK